MATQFDLEITPESSIWSKAAAILIVALVAVTFVLWLGSWFAPHPTANSIPQVEDSAGILGKQTLDALTAIHFPDDTPVIVRTVSKIRPSQIGSFATEAMNHDPTWDSLRHRGFLRRYLRHDLPSGTGVFVLVSVDPLLLQIRYGDELRLAAYKSGLAAGPWYRRQQTFSYAQIEVHTVAVVTELAGRMEAVRHPSWLVSFLDRFPSEAYSEIEDRLAPSSESGSSTVVSYVEALHWLGGTKSLFAFFVVNFFVLFLPWTILTKLFLGLADSASNKVLSIALAIISKCAFLSTPLIPIVALVLLAHGRCEDDLALSNLGLGALGPIGFGGQSYACSGGVLIALTVAILKFLVQLLEANREPPEMDGRKGIFVPLGVWPIWAGAVFVLPRAVGMFAIPLLLCQLAVAIVKSATKFLVSAPANGYSNS